MSDLPNSSNNVNDFQLKDFDKITEIVKSEFQIQEALLEKGTPMYYLSPDQETKEEFLRLLDGLDKLELVAFLRKIEGRVVLRVTRKPPEKPSNSKTNLILLIATIGTTFITGYIGFPDTGINPIISGAMFSAAMLMILGIHEMGHKFTANKKKIETTKPYFLPGPPPLGTLGAVIMQKSLPRNRDALFDVGANGPISGFIVALIISAIGLLLLVPAPSPPPDVGELSLMPASWIFLAQFFSSLNLFPSPPPNGVLLLHPLAWAGWAGMIVTMLNLLPAATLDGGHIVRSILANEKARLATTFASVALLLLVGPEFVIMAFLIVFFSMFKHPGPLDDVSSLSKNRKLLVVVLIVIFILSFPIRA